MGAGMPSVRCRFAAGVTTSESRRLPEPRKVLTVLLDAMDEAVNELDFEARVWQFWVRAEEVSSSDFSG